LDEHEDSESWKTWSAWIKTSRSDALELEQQAEVEINGCTLYGIQEKLFACPSKSIITRILSIKLVKNDGAHKNIPVDEMPKERKLNLPFQALESINVQVKHDFSE
jgi:hypothetical protein